MTYEVVVERDETGAWIARVPKIRGCHTFGRSLRQARNRIREALALWVDDADRADLRFTVRLPSEVRGELRRVSGARARSEAASKEAGRVASSVASNLSRRYGMSRRDVADLLGLSHQRVQQILQN
ncbi:MAG: type II toxin-antitoxin system HicB family antitoxin [Actinomycetota bacterium]